MDQIKEGLAKYLPENSLDLVCSFLPKKNLELSIVNDRTTKLGDFRPASRSCYFHRISINKGLNPYSFLLTLLHEIAHLYVFEKYGVRVKAHGCEWQLEYTGLILPFLEQHLLPDDLHHALFKHFPFPTATSYSDKNLEEILRNYDGEKKKLLLQDIFDNEQFVFNGEIYKRLHRLRSFYKCIRMMDKKPFRIHALAPIQLLKTEETEQS